jgi:hypothetical protein
MQDEVLSLLGVPSTSLYSLSNLEARPSESPCLGGVCTTGPSRGAGRIPSICSGKITPATGREAGEEREEGGLRADGNGEETSHSAQAQGSRDLREKGHRCPGEAVKLSLLQT